LSQGKDKQRHSVGQICPCLFPFKSAFITLRGIPAWIFWTGRNIRIPLKSHQSMMAQALLMRGKDFAPYALNKSCLEK
jgi:hypothetical protein